MRRTFLWTVLLGFLLSVASCFIPYDRCGCGGAARGLPLPIFDPHSSTFFFFFAICIDVLFWGAVAYAVISGTSRLRRRSA